MVLKPHFALWLLCLGIMLLSADARGRGRRGRGRGSGGHRRRREEEAPEPELPNFEGYNHSKRLDATGYVEKVEKVANVSQRQLYFPFVLFHASWSKQSKLTQPEFEKGAEYFKSLRDEGKLKGLERPVKFFVIECDKSKKNHQLCSKQVGGDFPVLKLFRDSRAIQFNGQWRFAKPLADWAAHVSRPTVLQVTTKQEIDTYTEYGTLFMIKAETASHPALLKTWVELSYEYLEDYYLAVVPTDSEVAKLMPPAPSVTVRGKNMDPLPLPRKLTVKSMREWVFNNRWPVVVDMNPEVFEKLMKLRRNVVVLVYETKKEKNQADKFNEEEPKQEDDTYEVFRTKALELRQESDLMFASLDCAIDENSKFLAKSFPVVSPPSIFVFNGAFNGSNASMMYWEDPWLTGEDLTVKKIKDMIKSSWNKQDATHIHWAKGWTKRGIRMGTGSILGFVLVVLLPAAFCGLCCLCVQEFMKPDPEEELRQANYAKMGKEPFVRESERLQTPNANIPKLQTPSANVPQTSIIDRRSQLEREMEAAAARGDYVRAGALQTHIQKLFGQSTGVVQETAPHEEMMTPEAKPMSEDSLRSRR